MEKLPKVRSGYTFRKDAAPMPPITYEIANAIYDILSDECAAHRSLRDSFIAYITSDVEHKEFRFGGKLGFGGKFYVEPDRWAVACYPEDCNPRRGVAIALATLRLKKLLEGLKVKP